MTGAIDASALAGLDLFGIRAPATTLAAGEVSALDTFLQGGGTLLVSGASASSVDSSIAVVNALLTGLGTALSLGTVNYDNGTQFATGTAIADTPLTAGVTSFQYGATAEVFNGATDYFFTTTGEPFIASDIAASPIPLPAGAPLMIAALGALAVATRKFRKA